MSRVANLHITENARDHFLKHKGILFIVEDVDFTAFREFARDLVFLANQPKFQDGKKPIWVVLNSPGGDVYHGLGINNLITGYVKKGFNIPILGSGLVASMGITILQAGSKRYSLPHTQFLIHQISTYHGFDKEEVNEAEENAEELKRLNRIDMELIAKRIGISVEELLRMSKKTDCWFDPGRALKLGSNGLIDKIIDTMPF